MKITQALCTKNYLLCEEGLGYQVSDAGTAWFREMGIEIGLIKRHPSRSVALTGVNADTISRVPLASHLQTEL